MKLSSASVQSDWSIELLRGLASLLVVFAHYITMTDIKPGLLAFAFTGVDLFFILSGFVFAPYFFGKPINIFAHFIRRFFRLYPLYGVALILYAFLRWQPNLSAEYFLRHAFFLHTLETREIAFHFNPAFWSLPPEVEFYFILPALALLSGALRPVLIMTLMAFLVHITLAWFIPPYPTINFFFISSIHLPALLVEFMFGVVTWWAVSRSPNSTLRILLAIVGIACWLVLASVFTALGDAGIEKLSLLRGNMQMLAAFAFALIVTAWVGWITQPALWLVTTASVLGQLSYGIYLFHNAAPIILDNFRSLMPGSWFAVLCLGLTILIAYVLHRICEEPCRQLGRRLSHRVVSSSVIPR